jgi:hypothetical protein
VAIDLAFDPRENVVPEVFRHRAPCPRHGLSRTGRRKFF